MKRRSELRYAKQLISTRSPSITTRELSTNFLLGDLVLRKVTLATKEPNPRKLNPTWEGPYKIVKVFRLKTY